MSAARSDEAARLRRDIADLERLMVDMPPHHAGGTRRGAEERLDDLRRALHRAERAARAGTDASPRAADVPDGAGPR